MAKRRLTGQQQTRINSIMALKQKRQNKRDQKADAKLSGEAGPAFKGMIIAHFGVTLEVEALDGPYKGQNQRCYKRANVPALVTGDQVIWHMCDDNEGVIVAVCERHSLLSRPDMRGQMRPVASNIDQIFIVAAPSPNTPLNLIDRYLVAAHGCNIEPVIVLNKQDLLTPDHPLIDGLIEYQRLGYRCITLSCQDEESVKQITALAVNKISIFVGQSAVGKSSLINALFSDVNVKTNEVSEATGKGKHTTTTARLYHGENGCDLIDSPGVREFGLWHIDEDTLIGAFGELNQAGLSCKFRDCKHKTEPGCAVTLALENGLISQRRFSSFNSIRESLNEVDMKNG
ncbi:MAG: small ribosomal subunit biogenesis GTPase RsgA [Saccharospirillaceae bacterium]|nr:small ribosomal subunit biogenesis GTPase RsgA [Pseudomonadales bacterium]NRB81181.1 small ribosomal subunit biogenesis GTPase RsgA [Saccharospirillaceae bacterium]